MGKIYLLAAALGLVFAGCYSAGTVRRDYDRFHGQETIVLDGMSFAVSRPGIIFPTPSYISLRFIGVPGADTASLSVETSGDTEHGWKYLHCHDVAFLADSKPVNMFETAHDGRMGSGTIREIVTGTIPISTIEALAGASLAEGRICNDEFSLGPDERTRLQEWLTTFRAAPVRAATAYRAPARVGRIDVRQDRFTGATFVELKEMTVVSPDGKVLKVRLLGATNESRAILSLQNTAARWQYNSCHSLAFAVDGEPMASRDTTHRGTRGRRSSVEFVSTEVTLAQVGRLANAESVEGRLCTTEFELTAEQKNKLSEWLVALMHSEAVASR